MIVSIGMLAYNEAGGIAHTIASLLAQSVFHAHALTAEVSEWEIVVDTRKVVGLSQVRRRTGTLLQVGILLDIDGARLASLLQLDAADRRALTVTLAQRATGLCDQVDIDRAALIAELTAAITDPT